MLESVVKAKVGRTLPPLLEREVAENPSTLTLHEPRWQGTVRTNLTDMHEDIASHARFVKGPDISVIVAPLYALLRTDAPLTWGQTEQSALDLIKKEMCMEAQALRHVNTAKPLFLNTGWSIVNLGR